MYLNPISEGSPAESNPSESVIIATIAKAATMKITKITILFIRSGGINKFTKFFLFKIKLIKNISPYSKILLKKKYFSIN